MEVSKEGPDLLTEAISRVNLSRPSFWTLEENWNGVNTRRDGNLPGVEDVNAKFLRCLLNGFYFLVCDYLAEIVVGEMTLRRLSNQEKTDWFESVDMVFQLYYIN